MELQATSPISMEALRTTSDVDVPTVVIKDVRAEAAAKLTLVRKPQKAVVEEILIPDQRAGLSPAQSVERKLSNMLQGGAAIPVSHFRLAKLCRKG